MLSCIQIIHTLAKLKHAIFFLVVISSLQIFVSCNQSNPNNLSNSLLADSVYLQEKFLTKHKNDTLFLLNQIEQGQKNDNIPLQILGNSALGNYYLENFQFERAIFYHHKSLNLAESINDKFLIAKSHNEIGTDLRHLGIYSKSAENFFQALSILSKLDEERKIVSEEIKNSYTGLGNVFLSLKQANEALFYIKKTIQTNKVDEVNPKSAINLANMGLALQMKNEYDSAFDYYYKSLEQNTIIQNEVGIAYCNTRIGNMYMLQNKLHLAGTYLMQAYNVLSPSPDKEYSIETCYLLGRLHVKLNKYSEAEKFIKEGMGYALQINSNDNIKVGHELMATLYKSQGKTEQALNELLLRDEVEEHIKSDQRMGRVMDIKSQFESEKNKEFIYEIGLQHAFLQKKQSNAKLLFIIFGGLLFLLFLAYIFYSITRNKKDNELIKQEKQKNEILKYFSDELKTPLNIILGINERLNSNINSVENTRNKNDLEIINRQSHTLQVLIQEMQSITGFDFEKETIKMTNGNIVAFLRYLISVFQKTANDKNIDLLFESEKDEFLMDYSPNSMQIIVSNLLNNAIKHCSENDVIRFFINIESDNYITFEIVDSGEIISKDDLFQILDTTNSPKEDYIKTSGKDKKLIFVKYIIESLHGVLEFRRDENDLNIFKVSLPITNNIFEEIDYFNQQEIITNDLEIEAVNKKTILIIIENDDLIYLLRTILQKRFRLLFCRSENEAFEETTRQLPDLIIFDQDISSEASNEFCNLIKKTDATSHIPVLVLSSNFDIENRVKIFNSSADAILLKPFSFEELTAIITQLLKNREFISSKYKDILFKDFESKTEIDKDFEFLKKVTNITYREISNSEFFPHGLASELAISTSQLNRRLNSITGLSCMNYVIQLRLRKAKKLLIESTKPIGEIAAECGYNDFSHFSRSFKKMFGYTPSQFQKTPQNPK